MRRLQASRQTEEKRAAVEILAKDTPDPETTEAHLRAVLVRGYQQAGMPLPAWLIGDAARKYLDGLNE